MKSKFILIAICSLCYILNIQTLQAQPPSNTSDQEIRERLKYINDSLEKDELPSRVWYWSFVGLYSAVTAAELGLYFAASDLNSTELEAEHFRQDMLTGAITGGIGILGLVIVPMKSLGARDTYSALSEDTREARVIKLETAEIALKSSAQWESENIDPLLHLANFGINLAAGLILFFGFDRNLVDTLVTFLPGFIVGEIQFFTQPVHSLEAWRRYQNKYHPSQAYNHVLDPNLHWHLAAASGGFMVIREF